MTLLTADHKMPLELWAQAAPMIGDGYDVMPVAKRSGWSDVDAWGHDGWNLGDWPYVVIYHRNQVGADKPWQLAYYVEGDVTVYGYATEDERTRATDELAFFHWKHNPEPWAKRDLADIETVDQLPAKYRGPYRPRHEEPLVPVVAL